MAEVDWLDDGKQLVRAFSFPDWIQGLVFINQLAPLAQALGHHPDVLLQWGKVTITLTTHDAGSTITQKDRVLAKAIDAIWEDRALQAPPG